MSIKYLNEIFSEKYNALSATERLLMVFLADLANEKGECWPGYDYINNRTGLSRSTISKCMYVLKETKLLSVRPHACFGEGKSVNKYTINLRCRLFDSSSLEIKGRIKELRSKKARPISSKLQTAKLRTSTQENSSLEHEPPINHQTETRHVSPSNFFSFTAELRQWGVDGGYGDIQKDYDYFINWLKNTNKPLKDPIAKFKICVIEGWARKKKNGYDHSTAVLSSDEVAERFAQQQKRLQGE